MIKLFEEYNDIASFCEKNDIVYYTINDDGSIDVDEDVDLSNMKLSSIPFKFRKVSGHFYCNSNILKSLEGCPVEVGGTFDCSYNLLASLEGCPKKIGGSFHCHDNQLTSLKGGPKEVSRNIDITGNNHLPDEIKKISYMQSTLKSILKSQDDYSIWNNDGSLSVYRFNDMMIEVEEGKKEINNVIYNESFIDHMKSDGILQEIGIHEFEEIYKDVSSRKEDLSKSEIYTVCNIFKEYLTVNIKTIKTNRKYKNDRNN